MSPIKLGSRDVKAIKLGGRTVKRVMLGGQVVWEDGGGPSPAGPVQFIASASAGHATSATSTGIPVPAGAQAADLLVAAIAQNSSGPAPVGLAGWTVLHKALNPNFDRPTWLAYRVIEGAPPESYAWEFDGATNRVVVVACFRGQHAASPILDDAWNQGQAAPPALAALEGCAAFGAWRRLSTAGSLDAPNGMLELTNEAGYGSNIALTTAIETDLGAGSYSRAANATLTNLNASMVLVRPA